MIFAAVGDAPTLAVTLVAASTSAITAIAVALINRPTARRVRHIDRAVNNQPDDAPTLIERATRLEQRTMRQDVHIEWTTEAIHAIASAVGVKVAPPPRFSSHHHHKED